MLCEIDSRMVDRDPPSGVLVLFSPDLMNSASCHLWLFTRQQITPRIFAGTSPVAGYYTTHHRDIWTGMAGWRQWFSSVGPVGLSRSIHRSSYLMSMTSTSMISPHIFSDPTTSLHLFSRPETPPTTNPMIMGPTSSWRDITAYQNWNGRNSMEPWNLLLSTCILFLWIYGIHFNNNQPL